MADKTKDGDQSDWLHKIKEQDGLSDSEQKQPVLDGDEIEIEVEIRDCNEEKEEQPNPASEEAQDGIDAAERKEDIKEEKEQEAENDPEPELVSAQKEDKEEIQVEAVAPAPPVEEETHVGGASNLPKNVYAHFLLIDIEAPVREIRGLPRCIPINNTQILIGRYAKAHIRLDDPDTVEIKHAKLIFEVEKSEKDFIIYQINNSNVSVNGRSLSGVGAALRNGDLVEIGSAKLIFFYRDLRQDN